MKSFKIFVVLSVAALLTLPLYAECIPFQSDIDIADGGKIYRKEIQGEQVDDAETHLTLLDSNTMQVVATGRRTFIGHHHGEDSDLYRTNIYDCQEQSIGIIWEREVWPRPHQSQNNVGRTFYTAEGRVIEVLSILDQHDQQIQVNQFSETHYRDDSALISIIASLLDKVKVEEASYVGDTDFTDVDWDIDWDVMRGHSSYTIGPGDDSVIYSTPVGRITGKKSETEYGNSESPVMANGDVDAVVKETSLSLPPRNGYTIHHFNGGPSALSETFTDLDRYDPHPIITPRSLEESERYWRPLSPYSYWGWFRP